MKVFLVSELIDIAGVMTSLGLGVFKSSKKSD